MIIKTVKRYYCEHCKKSGGSSFHMKNHETHCTLNPERKCRMCPHSSGSNGFPVSELIEILGDGCNHNFDELLSHVEGCPACILAAIRQSKLLSNPCIMEPLDYERFSSLHNFDFKASSRSFWNDANDCEAYY